MARSKFLKWSKISALAEVDDIRFLLLGCITASATLVAVGGRLTNAPFRIDPMPVFLSLACFSLSFLIWVLFSCFARLRLPTELQVFKNSAQYLQYRKLMNEPDDWGKDEVAAAAEEFYALTRMTQGERLIAGSSIFLTILSFLAGFLLFLSAFSLAPQGRVGTASLQAAPTKSPSSAPGTRSPPR